jgi:hypothetical protein
MDDLNTLIERLPPDRAVHVLQRLVEQLHGDEHRHSELVNIDVAERSDGHYAVGVQLRHYLRTITTWLESEVQQ